MQFLRNDGSTFTQVLTNIPTQGISGVLDVDMDGIEEVLRPGFFLPSRDAAWFGIDPINGLTRQGTVPTIMRGAWLGRCGVGDFDGNGSVDSGDFLQFRLRFLQSL